MAPEKKTKIAYLFGAGATHAELLALNPDLVRETHGLLISDVSARVIQKARAVPKYVSDLETVSGTSGSPIDKASGTSGSLNIELLISLIENSKIHDWASKTALLKRWVEQDIKHILTQDRLHRCYLHGALLRLHLHELVREKEEVVGFICRVHFFEL